jgi:hypothetical protein
MTATKPTERVDRKITRTFSVYLSVLEQLEDKARAEGHSNVSLVINKAIAAYLADDTERKQGAA